MANSQPTIGIGVVGTGYVSRHFLMMARRCPDLSVTGVLTRRNPARCTDFPRPDLLTCSQDELLEDADVVFECSGDPVHAADVVAGACSASRPVVTMDAEFHVTAGSYFVDKGLVTEAEGDQPGSLAAFRQRVQEMGFKPLVYGNLKGFLNHTPTREEMRYWANRNGITLDKVTSFTDGTKLQVEQALVANCFGATVAAPGMLGPQISDIEGGGQLLAEQAKKLGRPIADYLLFSNAPHGVFIVAEHDEEQQEFLQYVKLGEGPYYVLSRNNVLVHLEVPRTIRQAYHQQTALLNNSSLPAINVAAVAKQQLVPGTRIAQGIGSFELRGVCAPITDYPDAVPIGLMKDAVVTQTVEPEEFLTFGAVDLPDSLALKAWKQTKEQVLAQNLSFDDQPSTLS